MDILRRLHDSEINASVSSFFDSCWTWKLGDEMNGFVAENTEHSLEAALAALDKAARERYPDSTYAKAQTPHT